MPDVAFKVPYPIMICCPKASATLLRDFTRRCHEAGPSFGNLERPSHQAVEPDLLGHATAQGQISASMCIPPLLPAYCLLVT